MPMPLRLPRHPKDDSIWSNDPELFALPEVGAGAEEFGKAQGSVLGNAALLVEDGCDPVGGHVQRLGKSVCQEF